MLLLSFEKILAYLRGFKMGQKFCLVFLILFSYGADALEVPEPYYATTKIIRTSQEWRVKKNRFYVDWVELEVVVSAERKLESVQSIKGSGDADFAQQQIEMLKKNPYFFMSKKVNGQYVKGSFIHRVDFLMIEEDNPYFKDVVVAKSILRSSKYEQSSEQKKRFLLFVNQTHGFDDGKEVFSVERIPYDGNFEVIQINWNLVESFDAQFLRSKAISYEQLDNKFLISNDEYRKGILNYQYASDMFVSVGDGLSVTEYEYNQNAPFENKKEYFFERPKQMPPIVNAEKIFSGYSGELTLEAYKGVFTVKATVLPSGKLEKISFLKKSKIDRLNNIVFEALEKTYITPAYKNYQPAEDEIVFDLEFKKRGEKSSF